jgi:hypothetical protein
MYNVKILGFNKCALGLMFGVSLKYLYFVHVERMGHHRNSALDYFMVIGNHNALSAKKWKCNFCEVEDTRVATKIKKDLGGLQGHDIVSCPNISKTMFIYFSPRSPLVASMGNFKMFSASTNVAQNSGLQANNVPFEPSSRLCRFQTQLKITWCVIFKLQETYGNAFTNAISFSML